MPENSGIIVHRFGGLLNESGAIFDIALIKPITQTLALEFQFGEISVDLENTYGGRLSTACIRVSEVFTKKLDPNILLRVGAGVVAAYPEYSPDSMIDFTPLMFRQGLTIDMDMEKLIGFHFITEWIYRKSDKIDIGVFFAVTHLGTSSSSRTYYADPFGGIDDESVNIDMNYRSMGIVMDLRF